jgi:hypothetical protein
MLLSLSFKNRFQVTPEEILAVLACPDVELEPPVDVMLPEHLVPPERLEADMQVRVLKGCVCWPGLCVKGGGVGAPRAT